MTGRLPARDLALIATFAALIAVLGLPGQLNLVGNAVPVTAQTLGVMLAGSLLGAWRGALAVLTFCVLVLLGLPLLAGGRGGLGVLTSPSAGYFLGFTAGAFVVGALMGLWRGRFALGWALVANVVGGILVIYAIGIPLQAWITGLPLTAVVVKSAVFLPGDLVKAVVAAVVARAVVRAYPRAELAAPRERARAS
ncbi:MAG TPA: biotin transporter BioY [Kineosporiaceae bacterium]|nr:biotin transporter BioY [Kineosporiaceae bacterium]